jgi:hypothetical protein
VTESLTTDLSRIASSFVTARNTAFTYKSKPLDVKQIGHELNVRYVLEGSERFDKPVADLFEMQDEIVAHLADQLGTQLIAAEARRAERAPRRDSMDLYFRGMACLNRGWNIENVTQGFDFNVP